MSPALGVSIVVVGLLFFAVAVLAMGWWSDRH
jgi:hypothetical protein